MGGLARRVQRGLISSRWRAIVGETGYSASSYRATATGGGEAGVATGFGIIMLMRPTSLNSTLQVPICRTDGSNLTGWIVTNNTNVLSFYCRSSSALIRSAQYTLTSSDVGKLLMFIGAFDAAGVLRLTVNRFDVGADVAISGYTVPTVAMNVGTQAGAGPCTSTDIYSYLTYRGNLTLAQRQAFFDATRINGDLPSAAQAATLLASTVTHRWSMKDQLVGTLVVDGQTAPANLTDTVTGAAGDALTKVGTGLVVKRIDPTIDGRRTLGAQGFSTANGYQTATGKGVQGSAAGFFLDFVIRLDSLAASNQMIANCFDGNNGWYLQITSGNGLRPILDAVGTNVVGPSFALTAADLGRPRFVRVQYTGTALRWFLDGIQVGADVVGSYLPPQVATAMLLSVNTDTTRIFTTGAVFGIQGGNYSPTAGETTADFAEFAITGRLPTRAAQHVYDFSTQILASGVDIVPATITDTGSAADGTHNLTRTNTNVSVSGNFTGLTGFTALGKQLQRAGAVGTVANQSFWAVLAMRVDSQTVTSRFRNPSCKYQVTPRLGWDFTTTGSNNGSMAFDLSVGGSAAGIASSISGALGQIKVYVGVYDASAAMAYLYVDGVLAGSVAAASYAPFTGLETVGSDLIGAYVADGTTVFAVGGGQNFVPTLAEIAAQSATFQSTGTLPEIPNKTTRLNNFKADIVSAGGNVPAKSIDSKLSGDDFIVGSLQNLTIAQQTTRVWSYETTPIMYGGQTWTDSDYYSTGVGGGFVGAKTGYWITLMFVVLSQATSATRMLASCGNSLTGWDIRTTGLNAAIQLLIRTDGAGAVAGTTAQTIAAADVGKVLLFTGMYDPSIAKVRGFFKRLEGTQVAATAYAASATDGTFLGRYSSATSFSASNIAVLAMSAGNSIITLAEYQAQHDACVASERMVAIPGKTDFLVDFTQERGVPATLTDRVGSQNMTRTGSPALFSQYARAWGT